MDTRVVCPHCSTTVKNDVNLKTHLTLSKKCLKLRGIDYTSKYICDGCNSIFMKKTNLTFHQKTCKDYHFSQCLQENTILKNENKTLQEALAHSNHKLKEYEETVQKVSTIPYDRDEHLRLQVRYEDLEKQHQDLEKQHEKTITKLEMKIAQCDTFIQTLARDGINKVTTSNTVINNIRNQLSTTYTLDSLQPKQIEDTMRLHYTQTDFFGGQKRLAGVCVERIIKTPDGKMMICCTDMARKKFKILDVNSNLREDIEARLLCEKLKVPIQMITKEIYDKVIEKIENEKMRLSMDDRSKREKLLDDTMRAQQVYIDNMNFDDQHYNQTFMHELCVLLNI